MSWSRIVGHEHLIEAFRHVFQKRRLAHAYLFSGPSGVGKRLFAEELAKALLCESSNKPAGELAACDQCSACLLFAAQTHPDFFSVRRPEDVNVMPTELILELCAGFSLKSARGHGKVAILDDADDLNDEAANRFLKTLEEPPPRSVFILVGTSVDRQLPTILSRCQTVRFGPLAEEKIVAILKEHGTADPAQLERLIRLADGSPGQALALAEPALWDFRQRLVVGLTQDRIDTIGLAKEFVDFVEDAGKETSLHRRRTSLVLRLLIEFFADALSLSLGHSPKLTAPDEVRYQRAFSAARNPRKS